MKKERRLVNIVIILFVIGIILHWSCTTRKYALALTTPFLLTISIIVFYHFIKDQIHKKRSIIFLSIIFVFTLLVEILGVKTGFIFGNYTYGQALWPKIGDVPVVIGINWVVLVLAAGKVSSVFCHQLKINSVILRNLFAGILLVWVDYYIEPVAMKLDYWQWENGFVPLRNYFAWFMVSQFVYFSLPYFKVKLENNILKIIYLIMLSYFVLLKMVLLPCF